MVITTWYFIYLRAVIPQTFWLFHYIKDLFTLVLLACRPTSSFWLLLPLQILLVHIQFFPSARNDFLKLIALGLTRCLFKTAFTWSFKARCAVVAFGRCTSWLPADLAAKSALCPLSTSPGSSAIGRIGDSSSLGELYLIRNIFGIPRPRDICRLACY